MPIKATIVAYALSVQYSKNTAIVVYTGLRVQKHLDYNINLLYHRIQLSIHDEGPKRTFRT